jgi:hypothetical protein
MTTEAIELWHKRARPTPTEGDLNVQFGCHIEKLVETLDTVSFAFLVEDEIDYSAAMAALDMLATGLKNGTIQMRIDDRKEFLDGIADQVVTGIGVAYCAGMKGAAACERVNASNWSKFDHNGQPIRDANGKIAKGPNYKKPELDGLY